MAVKITQGEDVTVRVKVKDKSTHDPHVIASFEGVTGFFKNADDTLLAVTGLLEPNTIFAFPITKVLTAGLKAGDELDFEYRWMDSGLVSIQKVEGQLVIEEPLT